MRDEIAFFLSEDRKKKYSPRERESTRNGAGVFAGGSANPQIHARTTPDLPISLLILRLETRLQQA